MGYCPECGFKIGPEAYYCSYCGNRNFFMTMEKYLEIASLCGCLSSRQAVRLARRVLERLREYRVFKDSRTGAHIAFILKT